MVYYLDFGVNWHTGAKLPALLAHRPACDLCGMFRGRYLRKVGQTYQVDGRTAQDYRCKGCDEEGDR